MSMKMPNYVLTFMKSTFICHFQERAAAVVSLCVNLSCLLAVLAEPFMPSLSATLLEQLNANMDDVNVLLVKEKGQGDKLIPNTFISAI